jgi:hypothetical protein
MLGSVPRSANFKGANKHALLRRVAIALLLGCIPSASAFAQQIPDGEIVVGQWSVTNAEELLTGVPYEMYWSGSQIGWSTKGPWHLTWERTKGGHMIFMRATTGDWSGVVRDHRRFTVNDNDTYAIYNTKGRKYFVSYSCQQCANASLWSSKPSYEWKVQVLEAGGNNVFFRLYNTKKHGYAFADANGRFVWFTCRTDFGISQNNGNVLLLRAQFTDGGGYWPCKVAR